NNISRLVTHLRGKAPEQIRLRTRDVFRVNERCQSCHRQEYAAWAASFHSATYQMIFLNAKHNREIRLADDCLRCHGMHFDGGIKKLVTPVDATGPWKLNQPEMADRPAILCLSCHSMHRHGTPLARPAAKPATATGEAILPASVALFDRRGLLHVPVDQLPMPEMREQDRPVKISPDQRQALCYQCHAPLATAQVASGDDRTPTGVHEGLSCLACHAGHGQKTRASCAICHPRLSNCGIDVEKMDTSFKTTQSPHNIHFVKCQDCHTKGIPKKRPAGQTARLTASPAPAN
ncbi:MAG TPA: cytochrome c3 family protein, partial [Terriglobia bacterium]|nr:cytochrome c3 family protein [Terriglobia bacterium]